MEATTPLIDMTFRLNLLPTKDHQWLLALTPFQDIIMEKWMGLWRLWGPSPSVLQGCFLPRLPNIAPPPWKKMMPLWGLEETVLGWKSLTGIVPKCRSFTNTPRFSFDTRLSCTKWGKWGMEGMLSSRVYSPVGKRKRLEAFKAPLSFPSFRRCSCGCLSKPWTLYKASTWMWHNRFLPRCINNQRCSWSSRAREIWTLRKEEPHLPADRIFW